MSFTSINAGASPAPQVGITPPPSSVEESVLGKRKRESEEPDEESPTIKAEHDTATGVESEDDTDDDDDDDDDLDEHEDSQDGNKDDDHISIPDDNTFAPDDYTFNFGTDQITNDGGNSPLFEPEEPDDFDDDNWLENAPRQDFYDANIEKLPKCSVYDPAVESILTEMTEIPQQILKIIRAHGSESRDVKNQAEAAEALLAIPKTKKPRIAFIGDAGLGKSATLNSITDIDNLAKSLGSIESCTCVTTEYHGEFASQKKPCAAKIRYLGEDKIRELLSGLLTDYNRHHFQVDSTWDKETRARCKLLAANASDIFQSLLRNVDEFATPKAMKAFLKRKHDTNASPISFMVKCCKQNLMEKNAEATGYFDYIEADNLVKLRKIVDPLITSRANSKAPALWPLIKQVVFGIAGSRVLEHVTIVDLPGISDSNYTRRGQTLEYLRICDAMWIFTKVSRVADDSVVKGLLTEYGKSFDGNVVVVCTHSEEKVDVALIDEMRAQGADCSTYDAVQQKHDTYRQRGRFLSRQIKKGELDGEELFKMQSELDNIKKSLTTESAEVQEQVVNVRNLQAIQRLRATANRESQVAENKTLEVFCISNLHYRAHKTGIDVGSFCLTPTGTGIPRLREFALECVVPARLRDLNNYRKSDMQMFLSRLGLWVNAIAAERRKKLLETVKKPRDLFDSKAGLCKQEFKKILRGIKTHLLKAQPEMIQTAVAFFDIKAALHASTFRAFIHKNGDHGTKLLPTESWNKGFSKYAIDIVKQELEIIAPEFKAKALVLQNGLFSDLAIAHNKLEGLDNLSELTAGSQLQIERAFEDAEEEFQRGLRDITMAATQNGTYFSALIQPVYDDCKNDRGEGVTGRMKGKLGSFLAQEKKASPFAKMRNQINKQLRNLCTKYLERIEGCRKILENLSKAVEPPIERDVNDEKGNATRKSIQVALPDLKQLAIDLNKRMDALQDSYAA